LLINKALVDKAIGKKARGKEAGDNFSKAFGKCSMTNDLMTDGAR